MCRRSQVVAFLPAIVFWAVVYSGRAEVVHVDVYEWSRTGTGTTASGWSVCGIDEYADKGVRLNTRSEFAISPLYPGCVTQLVVKIRASSKTTNCFLSAVPVVANASAKTQSADAVSSYVVQTFGWSHDEGVRQFRFQNIGSGNAGWGILSLDVYLDRVEAPQYLREHGRYSNALTIRWTPERRAVSNEVELARLITILPTYGLLERWDFSVLTNATGNPLSLDNVPGSETLIGVSGEYLSVQARSGGYLQAGNTKGAGKVCFSLKSSGERTALLRMYRSAADGTDGPVSVSIVGEGSVTNMIAEPYLTTNASDFTVEVPGAASVLLVESAVKSRRLRIEDLRIVTDYVPGCVTTNVTAHFRTARNSRTVKRLDSGDWIWRVKSFDRRGDSSAWSPYRAVSLSAADPPYPVPGLVILVR